MTRRLIKGIAIATAVIVTTLLFYVYDYESTALMEVDLDLLLLRGSGSSIPSHSTHDAHEDKLKTIRKTIRRPTFSPNTPTTTLFDDIEVEVPDVTDRHTLLKMARLAQNAYVTPDDESWMAPPAQFSGSVESFGWEANDDGLRGHVFASPDNSTVVVSIKGTSAGLIGGGGPSAKNDKYNVSGCLKVAALTLTLRRTTCCSAAAAHESAGRGIPSATATTEDGSAGSSVSSARCRPTACTTQSQLLCSTTLATPTLARTSG